MILKSNHLPIRILVAEDQETDAFFIEQAFAQSDVENQVFLVKDGQEVMDYLMQSVGNDSNPRPDLIFLDIKMPRKDGHETLREIKSQDDYKDIPVIIMSGSQAIDDIKKSYSNGANAYVSKTNGFDDMIELVEAVEKFWFLRAKLPRKSDA
ncbi:MAG: response regulator [Alphaproteobacteria bacterium]|nr:response regulator [Alphaproteobacteria bacterium]